MHSRLWASRAKRHSRLFNDHDDDDDDDDCNDGDDGDEEEERKNRQRRKEEEDERKETVMVMVVVDGHDRGDSQGYPSETVPWAQHCVLCLLPCGALSKH